MKKIFIYSLDEDNIMDFYNEVIDLILLNKIQSKEDLHKTKVKLCQKYKLDKVPADSEILARLPDDFTDEEKEMSISLLRKKSMRTISGVAIVAVMTSPEECPHGLCIQCPGGPNINTPQSYTGREPAALRAFLNDYDPYLQTQNRIKQLNVIGHSTNKIDMIIMGGTFTARSPYYQEWFVKRCFDALNESVSKNLDDAKIKNEKAAHRCIGLTIETRPDWFRLNHADQSLYFGVTRVELGVQTVYDSLLYNINRGHNVVDSILATRIAKDSGFKVCYHIMPGLPGSDFQMDVDSFLTIFENSDFKPDMIKIYPTLTIEGTELYNMWKKGDYKPLSTTMATKLVAELKTYVPEWVRIQRIQRDVPSQLINAGVDKSNLRQLVEKELAKHGKQCRCIRCREIGHKSLRDEIIIDDDDIGINSTFYQASESDEVFISLVNEKYDALIGYLRLRNITKSHRSELNRNPCMIIRELKIVGRELEFSKRSKKGLQHKGYGKELVDEAIRICSDEFEKKHIFVLSGVGVKQYYRKLGFKNDGVYLSKTII